MPGAVSCVGSRALLPGMQDARCALDGCCALGEFSRASNAMCPNAMCRIWLLAMSDVRRAWGRESQYPCRFVEIERYSEKTLDISSLGSILRDFEILRPHSPESRVFESLIFRRFCNMPTGVSLSSSLNISSGMPVGMIFSDSGLNISEGEGEIARN